VVDYRAGGPDHPIITYILLKILERLLLVMTGFSVRANHLVDGVPEVLDFS
jgi:hypothetical protein